MAKLDDIAKLGDDWDGYGARPISLKAIETARFISDVCWVPMSNEGLLLDIRNVGGLNVEIEIDIDGNIVWVNYERNKK